MTDETPKKKAVRIALTKTQAAEGLGRELIELSRAWLADGKLDESELAALKTWLAKVPAESLPAIRFLQQEVERYIADGEVHDWELARLQAALIRVIPPKDREDAKLARSNAARIEWEQRAPEREATRYDSSERSRALRERYATAWSKEPATERQLDYIRDLGGDLPSTASKLEASEMIDRLLGREVAQPSTQKNSGCLSIIVVGIVIVGSAVYLT